MDIPRIPGLRALVAGFQREKLETQSAIVGEFLSFQRIALRTCSFPLSLSPLNAGHAGYRIPRRDSQNTPWDAQYSEIPGYPVTCYENQRDQGDGKFGK